ncbi:aminoglycoside phosphotransferase family protein [Desulfocicer niacini]
MIEDYFRKKIEKHIAPIQSITPIEKGFSIEKKFKITTDKGDYLLRASSMKTLDRKTQEFELMRKLHKIGVRCNNPIIMFRNDSQEFVYAVYSFLPGIDAEVHIATMPEERQYKSGIEAGADLKKINSLSSETTDWKSRKWKKHEYYVSQYFEQNYRFKNDKKVLKFIEMYYDTSETVKDQLQHDDFHLGNIILNNQGYVGVLDFNRYDWGDPLHEFVKLEWFTWPVSEVFARGQIEGYFGKRQIDDMDCLQISVYIAMSILSTIVWTLKFHPHTWIETEAKMRMILDHFDYFESIRPKWAA